MIHIVFEDKNEQTLSEAIALDSSLHGEILSLKDDYSVGPVSHIFETDGYQNRKTWLSDIYFKVSGEQDYNPLKDDKLTVQYLKRLLEEQPYAQVWIWMGQNAHDVCAYYWMVSQLRDYQGRIFVLYLNNLPFISDTGSIFYPQHLYEIPPREFLKAKKLSRVITQSEFEIDPDEWDRIGDENAFVRNLEGGKKIMASSLDCYDEGCLLLSPVKNFIKARRLAQQVIVKQKIAVSEFFLVWRIRLLVESGKLQTRSEANSDNYFELEVRRSAQAEISI